MCFREHGARALHSTLQSALSRPRARVQLKLQVEMEATTKRSDNVFQMVEFERKSWKERVKKYEEIKLATRNAISDEFASKLRKGRNWRGRIDVDHQAEHVYLSVAANKGALRTCACAGAHFGDAWSRRSR